MKKTEWIDLLQIIKKSKVSFISIIMFVALGLGILFSFSWIQNSLYNSTDNFVDNYNLYDARVIFPYGFSDKDIDKISKLDGVKNVEGRNFVFKNLIIGEKKYVAEIFQITNTENTLYVNEGALPQKCDEIAVSKAFADANNIKINDTIELVNDNNQDMEVLASIMKYDSDEDDILEFMADFISDNSTDEMQYFKKKKYCVTAIVSTPEYAGNGTSYIPISIKNETDLDAFCFVNKSAFKEDAFLGYTDLLISFDGLGSMSVYSDEYKDASKKMLDDILPKIEDITAAKTAKIQAKGKEVKSAIEDKITLLNAEINNQKELLDNSQIEIDEGAQKIFDAKQEIEQGKREIAKNKSKIADYEQELAEGAQKLDSAREEIKAGEDELAAGKTEYEEKYNEWIDASNRIYYGTKELEEGKDDYWKGYSEYKSGKSEYEKNLSDYNEAKDAYSTFLLVISDCLALNEQINSGEVTEENYAEKLVEMDLRNRLEKIINVLSKYIEIEFDDFIEFYEELDSLINNPSEENFELVELFVQLLSDNTDAIDDVKLELEELLEDNKSELDFAAKKLDDAKSELDDARDEINAGKTQLEDGKRKLNEARGDLSAAKKDILDGETELASAKEDYSKGIEEYNTKKQELEDGKVQLEKSEKDLQNAQKIIAEKETELQAAYEQLVEAKKEIDNAEDEVGEKKTLGLGELSDFDEIENVYLSMTSQAVVYLCSVDVVANIFNKMGYSLAGLFVVVGVFVCYSTITRLVHSQSVLMGTKKAIGFSDFEITVFYLMYVLLASICGCILGVCIGLVCEKFVSIPVFKNYAYDEFCYYVNVPMIVTVSVMQIAILVGIAYFSSKDILAKSPVDLLNGANEAKQKSRFYEKWKVFQRTGIVNKIIINNCFNDKKRVVGTVFSIAGCTALIVTALIFVTNIYGSFDTHYEKINHFNYIIFYDNSVPGADDEIEKVIRSYTDTCAKCQEKSCILNQSDGRKTPLYFFCYDNLEDYKEVLSILPKEKITGKEAYDGLWMSYSYRNYFGKKDTDHFSIVGSTEKSKNIPVDGFMNYYLTHSIVTISKENMYEYFGEQYEPNAFLANLSDEDSSKVIKELDGINGFLKYENNYQTSKRDFNTFSGIAAAIEGVYMSMSVVLAVLVLLNLLNQFVEEKKNELIILQINGYQLKDVRKYIYVDTIILTIVGIIIGVLVGMYLSVLAVSSFDGSFICFIKTPSVICCIEGALGAAFLTFIMCKIAMRKIEKFDLSSIT